MDTAKSAAVAVPPVATEDTAPPPPSSTANVKSAVPAPPLAPAADSVVGPPVKTFAEVLKDKLTPIVSECVSYDVGKSKKWASYGLIQVGNASSTPSQLAEILSFNLGPNYDVAWFTYKTTDDKCGSCVLKKENPSEPDDPLLKEGDCWTVWLDHRS